MIVLNLVFTFRDSGHLDRPATSAASPLGCVDARYLRFFRCAVDLAAAAVVAAAAIIVRMPSNLQPPAAIFPPEEHR